jgi:hypothetical protein
MPTIGRENSYVSPRLSHSLEPSHSFEQQKMINELITRLQHTNHVNKEDER